MGLSRQQSAQSAADAAALAGAQAALFRSGGTPVCGTGGVVCQPATACSNPITDPPANDIDSACLYAKVNGFAVGSGSKQNVLIQANTTSPPPTAPGVNSSYYVTARVSETFPLTFTAVLGRLTQLTSARATAVISQRTKTCLYLLAPNGTAFQLTGSGSVNAQNCGIFVNSNDPTQAMTMTGSGTINADQIQVVGGLKVTGSGQIVATPLDVGGTFTKTGSGTVSPVTSTPGTPQIGNPLSYLQPPAVGSCDHASTVNIVGSSSVTLFPGVYCGGISITGSGTVTFNPGTYILNGGGLSQTGSGTLTGSGVTFYDTSSSGHTYGPISITGSATLNLSAPTAAGPLQGILFFQDPAEPVGTAGSTVTGSSSSNMNGVFYFPTTSLSYTGSGTSTGYTSFVAYSLTLTGSGAFNDNYAAIGVSPFKAVALVE